MNQRKISDSLVYVSARYGAFFLASLVSALFNVILFASLDPSWWYVLVAMSIALEGAKLTTVLSYNVMTAMYMKLGESSLKFKARGLLCFYLVYGLLSMVASLGFSTVATSKRAAMEDYRVVNISEKIVQVEDIQTRINDYETMKDVALTSYRPYVELQAKIEDAREYEQERQRIYVEADDRETRLGASTANGRLTEADGADFATRNAEYAAARQEMIGFRAQYTAARNERVAFETDLARIATEHAEGADRADERIADLLAQFLVLGRSFGLDESLSPSAAITQLREDKGAIESEILRAKGMAYMFDKFSEFTGGKMSPTAIMFSILMLISVLLEITIYQCSPDIKVDRHVLRYFRRSLPKDVPLEDIIAMFDADNAMFTTTEKEPAAEAPVAEVEPEAKKRRAARKKAVVVSLDRDGSIKETPIEPMIVQFSSDEKSEPSILDVESEKSKTQEETVETERVDDSESYEAETTEKEAAMEREPLDTRPRGDSEHIAEEINDGSSNAKERYRFATTTPFVVSKFSEFIEKCVGETAGPFIVDPAEVAKDMKLNASSKEVFLGRLMRLMNGDKPLVERGDEGYTSNFGRKEIIEYVSQKV